MRGAGIQIRLSRFIPVLILIGHANCSSASQLDCQQGDPIITDLGDGVTLRTCVWRKNSGTAIRVGPLELVKNGILILRTQTNSEGKVHGSFKSWTDAGDIQESGNYEAGLKEGLWIKISKDGTKKSIQYKNGIPIEP